MSEHASLLQDAHRATGGLGLDIQTFGGDGTVEVRWRRSYEGVWSDERFISAPTMDAALRAVVAYEENADAEELQAEKSGWNE